VPILDFKEIPRSNIGGGVQDLFELFSRDFLDHLGYEIVSQPTRGADGGLDIKVKETRTGVGGQTTILWLASCKHFAHSGSSVTPSDETNILDRVKSHGCTGFLAVYSTLPSSSLGDTLEGLNTQIEIQLFDAQRIEGLLLSTPSGMLLAERYFPSSFSKWTRENPKPASLFSDQTGLFCDLCGKPLLTPEVKTGVYVIWRKGHGNAKGLFDEVRDIYWAHSGNCDYQLRRRYDVDDALDMWQDIPDICIPTMYA
jgi:hypothetical protein